MQRARQEQTGVDPTFGESEEISETMPTAAPGTKSRRAVYALNTIVLVFTACLAAIASEVQFGPSADDTMSKEVTQSAVALVCLMVGFVHLSMMASNTVALCIAGVFWNIATYVAVFWATIQTGIVRSVCDANAACATELDCTGTIIPGAPVGKRTEFLALQAFSAILFVACAVNGLVIFIAAQRNYAANKAARPWPRVINAANAILWILAIVCYVIFRVAAIELHAASQAVAHAIVTVDLVLGAIIIVFYMFRTMNRDSMVVKVIVVTLWVIAAFWSAFSAFWFTYISSKCTDEQICSTRYSCTGAIVSAVDEQRVEFATINVIAYIQLIIAPFAVIMIATNYDSNPRVKTLTQHRLHAGYSAARAPSHVPGSW